MSASTSALGADDDTFRFDVSQDGAVERDLGAGDDVVEVRADAEVAQVRLTFTSAEVGNGLARDGGALANQDGGLAVRVQAEAEGGGLTGTVGRFDDEGITFESDGSFTFDVRDLVSGVQRGDQFDLVKLGTQGNDSFDDIGRARAYYVNAGQGNDEVTGGILNDFLVGGAGNDRLIGKEGADSFIGGGGNDDLRGGDGNDVSIVNVSSDGADKVNLKAGLDTVNVSALAGVTQVRVTFTSAEVGNGVANDGRNLDNQDGRLAVRLQAEDAEGGLAGPVGRYDDEGMRFVSATPGVTFDVRDLVSGVQRGDGFAVVQLGTKAGETFEEVGERPVYINAGAGDDRLIGGVARDFLVGGTGNDRLNGGAGSDSLLGGAGSDVFIFGARPGSDSILDFVGGTDKIDLSAFELGFEDLRFVGSGGDTLIRADTDGDGVRELQIRLVGTDAPGEADFIFG